MVVFLAHDSDSDDKVSGFVWTPPNKVSQIYTYYSTKTFLVRCYIKQSELYIDYQDDDQCTQEEIYDGCTTFPEIDCHPRKEMTSTSNKDITSHDTKVSPLEKLNINIVKHVPLHNVHLGLLGRRNFNCGQRDT